MVRTTWNGLPIRIRENSWIARIAAMNMRSGNMALVWGRTIHLHNVTAADFLKEERWVRHEVCHIQQYQRYGMIGFLTRYLWESLRKGYDGNRFEVEARAAETVS